MKHRSRPTRHKSEFDFGLRTSYFGLVVGHGSSETIRPSDVSVTPFESASEQWAGGDAAAGGWLAAMRAMAIEYQLATDASGNGLLL